MSTQVQTIVEKNEKQEPSLREWYARRRKEIADEKLLRQTLLSEFKENNLIEWNRRFDEMFDVWFRSTYRNPVVRTPSTVVATLVAKGLEQVERKINERAEIILMEMQMPNGKKLGDCTGSELNRMANTYGPFLKRLAARVKPRQHVRNATSEDQLKVLYETSGMNAQRKV